jgi:DNA-3-methyladenine glycosylase II
MSEPQGIDYGVARRHLMRRDPVLKDIIQRVGPCGLETQAARDPFAALIQSIAAQQLSGKAASTIYSRLLDLFLPDRVPDPVRLLELDSVLLRQAGFSRPKIGYLQDLATQVRDGRLDLAALRMLPNEEAMAALVRVKGIGRWTAEIFLMFVLARPDILPVDDLGLVNAIQRAYGMRQRPSKTQLETLGERWRPYRSVAAWYLWHSLGLPPTAATPASPRTSSTPRTRTTRPPRTAKTRTPRTPGTSRPRPRPTSAKRSR